jgi:hypothetical protein
LPEEHTGSSPVARHRAHRTSQNLPKRGLAGDGAFALRTWVIEQLGPDADPDWSPEVLAADTLAALTVDPDDVHAMSAGWRDLPIRQVGELRRQKNLTARLDRLIDILQPSPVRDRLAAWAQLRRLLP